MLDGVGATVDGRGGRPPLRLGMVEIDGAAPASVGEVENNGASAVSVVLTMA